MPIIRGTTPNITFSFDLDWGLVKDLNATFEQNKKDVFIVEKDRFTYSNSSISATLTQEECLRLKNDKCDVQLKVKTNDDKVLASNIITFYVQQILNEDVI